MKSAKATNSSADKASLICHLKLLANHSASQLVQLVKLLVYYWILRTHTRTHTRAYTWASESLLVYRSCALLPQSQMQSFDYVYAMYYHKQHLMHEQLLPHFILYCNFIIYIFFCFLNKCVCLCNFIRDAAVLNCLQLLCNSNECFINWKRIIYLCNRFLLAYFSKFHI